MFSVIFEVHPKPDRRDAYFGHAKVLRPELNDIDGFVDNVRYNSLTREGWILSVSSWRDEKAIVRWRTAMRHHIAQEKGRSEILLDYHLRVGEIIGDTHLPEGQFLHQQSLDETRVGEGTTITLVTATQTAGAGAMETAEHLGLNRGAAGLVAWDALEAVLSPGDTILIMSWRDKDAASRFEETTGPLAGRRLRRVRVVRDYGMFDRREAPQYYPDATRAGP
jgi:heme-degrading monooxygenase HmoA